MFDLDKIDEAASRRRLTLAELAEQLKQLDQALQHFQEFRRAARTISATAGRLDIEGRELLGARNFDAIIKLDLAAEDALQRLRTLCTPGPHGSTVSTALDVLYKLSTLAKESK